MPTRITMRWCLQRVYSFSSLRFFNLFDSGSVTDSRAHSIWSSSSTIIRLFFLLFLFLASVPAGVVGLTRLSGPNMPWSLPLYTSKRQYSIWYLMCDIVQMNTSWLYPVYVLCLKCTRSWCMKSPLLTVPDPHSVCVCHLSLFSAVSLPSAWFVILLGSWPRAAG